MTRQSFLVLSSSSAFGYPANETVRVGVIGAGGRGQHLMRNSEGVAGLKYAAVCDIWDANLEKGKQLAGGDAFTTKDYRALLSRKDLDAVLIATPDHLHAALTIAACEAGKDVYVEKPLTHSLEEGAPVIAAQNRYKRVVQVGMQQRSMPQYQRAKEIVESGRIGPVHKVRMTWNRNANRVNRQPLGVDPRTVDWGRFLEGARKQEFDEYRFRNWRWFWDFGGGIFTDLMVHQVDIAHWILGLDHPAEAHSIGDNIDAAEVWETPDTVQTLLRYPEKKLQAHFEGTFVSSWNGEMIEVMGHDGTIYLDRGRMELYPDPRRIFGGRLDKPKFEYEEMVIGNGPKGADFYEKPNGEKLHIEDWLKAVRTRSKPVAPAEAGVSSASAAHLANLALRSGQKAVWKG
ncbi:MAG: Gfo/Idh/MocA family oxidoreductase [Bryobacteraceae bacterium]|nr:Gfo/Idh/MocA family oxidoreductase [Bryobacteraceae bacterium]